MSNAIKSGEEIPDGIIDRIEADVAFPILPAGENPALQLIVFAEEKAFANPDLAAGPYQALPVIRIGRELMGQQNFDASVEKVTGRRILGLTG